MKVTHSVEGASGLETAGGIIKALPFFEGKDFLVVNGDTFIDADYKQFLEPLETEYLARLYLVDNPPHNQKGDFKIEDGKCYRGSDYTFSGTAVYKTKAFLNMPIEKKPLLPLFLKWSQIHELSAKPLCGKWFDVGTIERLNQVNSYIQNLN